ncbi:MAG: cyclic nucleotide-binding domain-containing protein [Defluviitaleaceae bacterium]|nr:cyclic nucleotide-binding domain-containing protein [Defluviitaleaceae bacterium]
MALSEFKQGSVICGEGAPLRHILFITKGSVDAEFNGKAFRLEQGGVIGLCALSAGKHMHTYTAATDVVVFSYPYKGFSSLEVLLNERPEVSGLLVNSMCRQITLALWYRQILKKEAEAAYELAKDTFPQYERLCTLYAYASKQLPELDELQHPSEIDPLEEWIHEYYTGISNVEQTVSQAFFREPGISLGFLRRSAEDVLCVLRACESYDEYLSRVAGVYAHESRHDLFALVGELHTSSVNIRGADDALKPITARLIRQMQELSKADQAYVEQRLQEYRDGLEGIRTEAGIAEIPSATGAKQNLLNSMEVILEYSGLPEEDCNRFARCVHEYTKLADRGSADDDAYRLREELTAGFYRIYEPVFFKSLEDPTLSTIVKMFLNFGYVDAALAGYEHADYLYSIADSLKGDPEMGVYTVREWLTAIYEGSKEPSRNDFDTDYAAYIREMKTGGKITAQEENTMLQDNAGKVRFELEQVFPTVNKITFGRISTFCPLFASHNALRSLQASMVTPSMLKVAIDEIRSIDFSAFYRETLYTNPDAGVPKESINVEILPEIILLPNIGLRGAMWQEIEGRKRASPSRLFIPLMLMEDIKTLMVRLTAEFRWEMCKRIQGTRWSDITAPSLTSEFFDYLQFYRSNRELSQDVKASVKTELVRARNIYKSVFVQNYADWLQYESNGSPRLNKFVRRIMMIYCPFAEETREKLSLNPQFAEPLKRFNIRKHQRVTRLSNLMQKVSKIAKEMPQELTDELAFAQR